MNDNDFKITISLHYEEVLILQQAIEKMSEYNETVHMPLLKEKNAKYLSYVRDVMEKAGWALRTEISSYLVRQELKVR